MKTNKPIDRSRITFVVLIGSSILFSIFFLLLTLGYFVFEKYHFLDRLLFSLCTLLYLGIALWQYYRHNLDFVAKWLVILYGLIATIMVLLWGINTPVGIFLYCFVILLSSVLLGSRYILPVTSSIIIILFLIQVFVSFDMINAELSYSIKEATFVDILTYSFMLSAFALLGWLYGAQIEQLLIRLAATNKMIADELRQEKINLRQAQVDELNSIYKFAEFGQNATLLVHDLANHLTQLSYELEDRDLKDAKGTLKKANELINNSTQFLTDDRGLFEPINEVRTLIRDIRLLHANKKIQIKFSAQKQTNKITADGNSQLFRHVVRNLISNAIQAYERSPKRLRSIIHVSIKIDKNIMYLYVQDYGAGISLVERKSIFRAGRTTKNNGHGIGLFISRKIMNHHFRGSLYLSDDIKSTCFILKIPVIQTLRQL